MKRSALLQPLSRKHHTGLVYAKRLLDLSEEDTDLKVNKNQLIPLLAAG